MTKVDMKYTSLFWKLGFIEERTDFYHKSYHGDYHIDIEAEKQEVNYGNNAHTHSSLLPPSHLLEHKDFVVLECVNRLLEKGYARADIQVFVNPETRGLTDIIVSDTSRHNIIAFDCKQWGKPYEEALDRLKSRKLESIEYLHKNNCMYLCLYSSRLDGGLLEYKTAILNRDDELYFSGIFEDQIEAYHPRLNFSLQEREKWFAAMEAEASEVEDIKDFRIKEGVLLKYVGKATHVSIPRFIVNIGTGAFWNCISLVSVIIPDGVRTIGGDAFYKCVNLRCVNIPPSVIGIGNNPFSGCPDLIVSNESPHFMLDNGVLYNADKTKIIHYTPSLPSNTFKIPESVKYIEKHCFYACNNLHDVTVPSSIVCMENNVFSGCKQLVVTNQSPYFTIKNGVLYNREKTQLYSVIDHGLEILEIPSTVKTIGKNSFWNCDYLRRVVIPASVTRIGYNPFAGCDKLVLENHSPNYNVVNGVLFNKDMTELIYCPNQSVSGKYSVPKEVVKVGRNAFSFCVNLEGIIMPEGVKEIGRGAFGGCKNLKTVVLPESLQSIGEWAFSFCENLKNITLYRNIKIEENTFAHCNINITRI